MDVVTLQAAKADAKKRYVRKITNSTTPEAYGAVGNTSGTDDAPAIQAAIAAVVAACIADGSYVCEVIFDASKVYYANRAPVQDPTTNHSYAQIALPYVDWIAEGATTPIVTLRLVSDAPKQANTVTFVQQPCAIKSTPTTGQGNVAGVGCPSVIGGPAWNNTNVPAFPHYSGIHLVIDGVNIIVPPNPPFIGLDAAGLDGLEIGAMAVYVPIAGGFGNPDPTQATHPQAWGVTFPGVSSGSMARADSLYVSGFYSAIRPGEHIQITRLNCYSNRIAIDTGPGAQGGTIHWFDDVHNQYGFATNGGSEGSAPAAITTAAALPQYEISLWVMETAGGRSGDVFDTNNKLTIDANYCASAGTAPVVVGGQNVNLRDINDPVSAVSKWNIAATIQPLTASRTSDTAANVLANDGHYLRAVDGGRGLSKFIFQVGTASGNISVAAYKRSGKGAAAQPTGGQIVTTGAIACPASGYVEVAPGGSTFNIQAGDFIGLSSDGTTATVIAQLGMGSSTTLAFPGQSYLQITAHPLPSTPSSFSAGGCRLWAIGARQ